jgi:hypothetical protein
MERLRDGKRKGTKREASQSLDWFSSARGLWCLECLSHGSWPQLWLFLFYKQVYGGLESLIWPKVS